MTNLFDLKLLCFIQHSQRREEIKGTGNGRSLGKEKEWSAMDTSPIQPDNKRVEVRERYHEFS